MKKLKSLCLCMIVMPSIVSANPQANEMRIGYTAGNMGLNLGMDLPLEIKGAIQLPKSELSRLGKSEIKGIRLAVGNNLTSQHNSIFITDNLDGEALYTQEVDSLKYGWNEIELTTPFTLNGEELYVGFSYESSGEVVSFDGEEDNPLANWLCIRQAGQSGRPEWSHQSGGSHNLEVVVSGEALPQHDVAIERHTIRTYACTQSGTPMGLVLRNRGAATLRTIDVSLTIDGESEAVRTIECPPTGSNELVYVNIGDLLVESNNIFDIEATVSGVNGYADEMPEDNTVEVKNVLSRRDYAPRKVLLEHFSTMRCSNCPTTHTLIEDALRYREDVIHVVYHSGFGTDALTIPASESYLWLFTDGKNGSYYAPGACLDRVNLSGYGATDGSQSTPGPVFLPRRDTMGKLLDRRLSTAALINVSISQSYDASTRELTVTVDGNIPNGSVERLGAKDPRETVLLTEDGIEGDQKGVVVPMSGPYIHDRALRCVLSDVWGDQAVFTGGELISKSYSTILPAEWNADRMRIVAFISDYSPSTTSECEVFNATEELLDTNAGLNGVSCENDAERGIAMKDGNVIVPAGHKGVRVTTLSGQAILTLGSETRTFSLRGYAPGVYLVTVYTANGMRTFKVSNK